MVQLLIVVVDGHSTEAGGGVQDGSGSTSIVVVLVFHYHKACQGIVSAHHLAPVGQMTVGVDIRLG